MEEYGLKPAPVNTVADILRLRAEAKSIENEIGANLYSDYVRKNGKRQ